MELRVSGFRVSGFQGFTVSGFQVLGYWQKASGGPSPLLMIIFSRFGSSFHDDLGCSDVLGKAKPHEP